MEDRSSITTEALAAALARVAPAGCAFGWDDGDTAVDELTAADIEPVARAMPRRQAEFLRGRRAAARALRALGAEVQTVGMAESGAPSFPRGIVGSITHSGAHALAAVADGSQMAALGLDVETRRSFDEALLAELAHPGELELVAECCEERVALGAARARMLVAAKEALYKAQFPDTKQIFGFLDIEVARVAPGVLTARSTGAAPELVSYRCRPIDLPGVSAAVAWRLGS